MLPDTFEQRWFNRFVGLILSQRWLAWLLVLFITGIATVGNFFPHVAARWGRPAIASTDNRQVAVAVGGYEKPPDVTPFGYSSGQVILVAESEQFFSADGITAMREVVRRLKALPYVTRVVWLEDVPPLNLFNLAEPIFPRGTITDRRLEQSKERVLNHPLLVGQLISADAKLMMVMVEVQWIYTSHEGDGISALREIGNEVIANYPGLEIDFSVTGRAPVDLLTVASRESNQTRYQLLGYGVVLVMATLLFRGISAVVIIAAAPILGVYWTLGFLPYFHLQDNPFNEAVLPVLLAMVGFTDGVHMMSQIRRIRASGLEPFVAAQTGLREVGYACFLTSLTTAIGFGSLYLAHHKVVQEFGLCCALGVGLTLLADLTIIPLICSTRFGKSISKGYGKNLIDRNLEKIVVIIDYVMRHRIFFAVGGIVVTLILSSITLTLRPDQRRTSMLPDDEEAVIALRRLDQKLGGMETGVVTVNWEQGLEENAPEIGVVMEKVDALLRSEPLIGHPLSIYNLIQALPGDGPVAGRMSTLELMPPPLKRAFYTPEYRTAETQFRVQDLGIATYSETFERVNAGLQAIRGEHPNFQFTLRGDAVWRWENLYQIVLDLCYSLGTASLVIFGVLAIVYRSLRLGLISIIPNIFPLAATGTIMVITGQYLEIVSVCAFTVCLGIAVDDTIHFLTRYREELQRTPEEYSQVLNDEFKHEQAVRRAFVGVGTALIMTTVVLVIGFSTALTSEARDTRVFVTMGMMTIGTALFADLLILPPMLVFFRPRRR